MLRAMLKSLFRRSQKAGTPTKPTRFAPALHALEPREVPAVVAFGTLADLALPDASHSGGAAVTHEAAPKVTVQDFHFTTKVSKSSP